MRSPGNDDGLAITTIWVSKAVCDRFTFDHGFVALYCWWWALGAPCAPTQPETTRLAGPE